MTIIIADSLIMKISKIEIVVNISTQKLHYLLNGKQKKEYSISTASKGIGNKAGSYKTPLGKHSICEKIGKGAKFGTIFKGKNKTKEIALIDPDELNARDDFITTRIMCLEGLEKGINRGKDINTKQRCIWIHGTQNERFIGKPASHGCIRMMNSDIIELFKMVHVGTIVTIEK